MTRAMRPPLGGRTAPDPGNGPAAFGNVRGLPAFDEPAELDFVAIQSSPEFMALRRRLRRFVFPMCAAFFAWYLSYVLLAAYAPGFMAYQLWGLINVGIVLGVGQFASTILITVLYNRFARANVDPAVDVIRQQAGVDE